MKRNGFSLIELMVVMGVLGLLTSLAVTGYPQAVGVARRSACQANLRSLRVILQSVHEDERQRGDGHSTEEAYVASYKWPGTVAAEANELGAFMCPEDPIGSVGNSHPPLAFRTGLYPHPLVPFDPSHYNCVMRTGVTAEGEPYTEYCVEDNTPVEAMWEYALGVKEFSTNDGVWRVYDNPSAGGRRKVVLVWYTCNWNNQIWVDGEHHKDLRLGSEGLTFYYDSATTSYGFNEDLNDQTTVSEDTIVLLDYPEARVDASQSEIYEELGGGGGARHFGKHNVLYAGGAVKTVGPASLYPDINMSQWTSALD